MKRADTWAVIVGTAILAILVAVGLLFYFNLKQLLAMSDHGPMGPAPVAVHKPPKPDLDFIAAQARDAAVVMAAPALDAAPPPPESRTLHTDDEPRLSAPLAAVKKELERCFADQAAHHREPGVARVRFRPLADGGFADVRVESDVWQDPYLDACLTDVFEELTYTPSGREDFATVVHAFRYERAP